MAPSIIRNASFHLNYAGPVIVDLSCDAIALEITPSTEEIDVGTFCNPSATEQGRTTYTAVASLLWSPALYAKLQPYVGVQGLLAFAPDATNPTDYVRFNTRFAAQPWGRFEVGQRVEVELPLAVLETPTWNDGTLLMSELVYEPPSSEPAAAETAAETSEVTPDA